MHKDLCNKTVRSRVRESADWRLEDEEFKPLVMKMAAKLFGMPADEAAPLLLADNKSIMAKDAMAPRKERERERESRSCLSFSPIFFCIRCWQHTVVHTLLIPSSTSYTHLGPADISFTSGRSIRTNLTPGHTKERIPSCVGGERDIRELMGAVDKS